MFNLNYSHFSTNPNFNSDLNPSLQEYILKICYKYFLEE